MRYYADASALVKRFKRERGQEEMRGIMHEAALGEHEVHSVEWAKLEFFAAMRRGGVPMELAMGNLRALRRIVSFNPIERDLIEKALPIIYDFGLHAADAIHLAACSKLGCEALLTDDEHLTSAEVERYLRARAIELVYLGCP